MGLVIQQKDCPSLKLYEILHLMVEEVPAVLLLYQYTMFRQSNPV
jgi:hypothetical protein